MSRDEPATARFDAEVGRVRASGVLGESGRLLELFDFLAARGPGTASASQAEIAETVFGHTETSVDDATVRVYVHRLRKRLEEYYAEAGAKGNGGRLILPSGTYALRQADDAGIEDAVELEEPERKRSLPIRMLLIAGLALVGAFFLGRALAPNSASPVNAIWQPFVDSPRPKLIVLGDYYIYGEIDPVRPEEGRLIRDFRVNSAADLERMQDLFPDRYGRAEDMGLNYLPFSVAYGLDEIVPILAQNGHRVSVLAASELQPDMLNYFDVIYVGLFSGMSLLEDVTFMGSQFDIGESYDELIDSAAKKSYTSEEARSLASPAFYRDYGYVARFKAPGGALVAIVAGARDTGLRGLVPLVTRADLTADLKKVASDDSFEGLFQITGQQGADLSETLLLARPRED
ncbi:MAG TPA: helix-turn-helix domain-containing protein [Croceibacterium sp.]|nr:helix-turn-helix domain-containing protein [Croceibacterium sp.]